MSDPLGTPRVSVGVPVFDGEDYLPAALDSLLAQTYPNFEVVISDNGSRDRTPEICREYAARDARVHYHREEENRGAAWNYNRVFELARGELFKWAAHDDLCAPDFLQRCVDAFDSGPPATVLVYPRSVWIDAGGTHLRDDRDRLVLHGRTGTGRALALLWRLNMANPVFGLIRSSALYRTRLIDSFVASDYVLLFELALLGRFSEVPERLFLRREHQRSSRAANRSSTEVTAWFDPESERRRGLSDRQRLCVEYVRSAWRLAPPLARPALTLLVPSAMALRRLRVLQGRWRRRFFGGARIPPRTGRGS